MTGRQKFYWLAGLLGVSALAAAFVIFNTTQTAANKSPIPAVEAADSAGIGCAGRIEPANGLIRIAARDPSGGVAVIDNLGIAEQQHVSRGQWVATLRGRELVEAALKLSVQRVMTAQLKLEQLRAAPKKAEFAARSEEIERLRIDYERAKADLATYTQLRKTEDVSASDLETRRAQAGMALRSLAQAQQSRSALAESREPDAAVLLSEVREAEAERARLQTELQLYTILSPVSGLVLRVPVHNGESVGPPGVAEVLEDGPLYAIAEVAEADIFRVKTGKRATVKGEFLPLRVDGVVESIGHVVAGSEVLTSDPSAFTDKRVVPVKIRLSGIEPSRIIIHARVSILIEM